MDRFKFKAIIKVDYCDKNEEDKVVNLVIENVAVDNGDVGFSESELTKTLDKLSLTDEEIENICAYLFDNYGIDYGNDTYFWCDKAKIIQCTGLKDKNGNLIYEGDIVIGRKEIVVCEMIEYKDVVEYKDGAYFPFNWTGVYKPEKFEIIGNIHEQAEQKDNK